MVLYTTYVIQVPYSCGVVLVFWFWGEIGVGVTYVLSVQYSCAVVSVFCCGGKANLVQIFLLNPRIFFLYIGIGIQRGWTRDRKLHVVYPDFHSNVKILRVSYSRHLSGKLSFTLLS